jgi:hypothetical protein
MPADDAIKPAVVAALVKDGWTITHDPLAVRYDELAVGIDLGAERLLAAARGIEQIAVEIKTFGSRSPVRDLRDAIGQYELYRMILEDRDPGRKLYLAVSEAVEQDVFGTRAVRRLLRKRSLPRIVVRLIPAEVVQWIR